MSNSNDDIQVDHTWMDGFDLDQDRNFNEWQYSSGTCTREEYLEHNAELKCVASFRDGRRVNRITI